jgi:hypothetical protein
MPTARRQSVAKRAGKPSTRIQHDGLLRTSERTVLNRCHFQHDLTYTRHLKPKLEAPALRFGTLIHQALENYYDPKTRNSDHPALTFERLYEWEVERTTREIPDWRDENDVWHDHKSLGTAMLEGYVDRWQQQDAEYQTLAVEQTFQYPIIIPPGFDPLPPLAPRMYVGTFDRILLHKPTRRLYLGDYKTTKNDPTKTKHLTLDEQAGAYWAFAPLWLAERAPAALQAQIRRKVARLPANTRKRILSDDGTLRFAGILYDFLAKKLPDTRPVNKDGQSLNKDRTVSKQQPTARYHREPVYRDEHDRRAVIERIYWNAVTIGQLRAGEMEVVKSPDRFHCMMCPFNDQCELHETGADWRAYEKATTRVWDPYDAHAIEDDEHDWVT